MDDDEMQQFNLRWHNHQVDTIICVSGTTIFGVEVGVEETTKHTGSSVFAALSHMYNTGELADVILSANGTNMKAHKIVLASCSQYFAQLFKEVDSDHTLVVVLSCDPAELRLLLAFMYTGEVTASKTTLPALLALARALKVVSLTHTQGNTPNDNEMVQDIELNESNSPINLETNKSDNYGENTVSPEFNMNKFRFNFERFNSVNKERSFENMIDLTGRQEERLSKLDQIVQNLYSTHQLESPLANVPVPITPAISNLDHPDTPYDRKWRNGSVCTICNKRLSNQYNLRVHMETHAGGRHACRTCNHVSRSRDALRKHVAYRHPNVAGVRGGRGEV